MNELEKNDVVIMKTLKECVDCISTALITDLTLSSSNLEKIYVLEDYIEIKKMGKI